MVFNSAVSRRCDRSESPRKSGTMLLNVTLLEKYKAIPPFSTPMVVIWFSMATVLFVVLCKYSAEKLAERLRGSRREVRGSEEQTGSAKPQGGNQLC